MKRYIFSYQTIVRFSQPVTRHAVLLRPLPFLGSYMNVEEEHLLISPSFHVRNGIDSLGNRIVYGLQHEPHSSLTYISEGIVNMENYRVSLDNIPLMVYRESTPLTFLSREEMNTEPMQHSDILHPDHTGEKDTFAMARHLCQFVYQNMQYVPSVTTTGTPASEVWKTRQGVCQDYAHLMIALCRIHDIAARYVCGMMEGEGETHAWVEVCDGKEWRGYDPTHDVEIKQGYLKLAHGRDAADCPVSRGLYIGNTSQQTEVHILLIGET